MRLRYQSVDSARQKGFSTIEGMITLTIICLLLTTGLPAFAGYLEKQRLRDAAEEMSAQLHYARSESILRGPATRISMSFKTDGANTWCYGLSTTDSCDCTITDPEAAGACTSTTVGNGTLSVVSSPQYAGEVSLKGVTFSGKRTTYSSNRSPSAAGQLTLSSAGREMDVVLTAMGRVRVCSSSALGYPTC